MGYTSRRSFISAAIIAMMVVMLFVPQLAIEGAKHGLLLWFDKLLPSLLPFMILMQFLTQLDVFFNLAQYLDFITFKLFHISGTTFIVFILGLVGGYPMGAKLIKELLTHKKIAYHEAQKALCCANNCGPIFIIGTVGTLLLGNPKLGYFLFLVHLFSACCMLLLTRYLPSPKIHMRAMPHMRHTSPSSISGAFTYAVQNGMATIVSVAGYIIFFSVLINLLKTVPLSPTSFKYFLLGSLEFSNGSALIASSSPLPLSQLALLSSIIGFGGFCVLCQSDDVLQGTKLPMKLYFFAKLFQGGFAYFITFLLAPLFFNLPTYPWSILVFFIALLGIASQTFKCQ